MGAGVCCGEVKGHFSLIISYVSKVDIEKEVVNRKKQNSACYIVNSANCNYYEG